MMNEGREKICVYLCIFWTLVQLICKEKNNDKPSKKRKRLSDKHLELMLLLDRWLIIKQEGKRLIDYFESKKYNRIVIYGMKHIGKRLYDELQGTMIEIVAVIDRNAEFIFSDVKVLSPDYAIPDADCMVIMPVSFFQEIKEQMSKKSVIR